MKAVSPEHNRVGGQNAPPRRGRVIMNVIGTIVHQVGAIKTDDHDDEPPQPSIKYCPRTGYNSPVPNSGHGVVVTH